MARRPQTTTTEGAAETPAAELTARQIARRATLELAAKIANHVDKFGSITITSDAGECKLPLSSISESLASAVEKIKKEKAAAAAAARAQLSSLLETEEGKKIAAELLAGKQEG